MRRLPLLAAALFLVAVPPARPQEAAAPAPPQEAASPGHDARVWIGHAAEYEKYLETAPIEKVEDVGSGVTHPQRAFFAPGGLAASAVVKHIKPGINMGFWESYKSEIAAYHLDQVLGLNMVPVTVERRVGSDLGAVQVWLEGCRLLKGVDQSTCPDPDAWARQVCRQRVFDNLIANIDRNAGNILIDDDWHLILIDHSRAFASNKMPFEKEMLRVDKAFFEKLKTLDEETLMPVLKDWVPSKGAVRAILKRRDKIVADFEKLVQEKGEAAVFPW
jgi:hypothetical protein